ncbi:GTP-Rho binding exocyst subunit EXO70 [Nakaseomyces bracarensis]|uniref:GTP-Rho binding exocyst subunit EXO70 n=1 Tax=Nakaseomyces bracarensis TaxID=273131 RepID=UPI0038722C19
MNAIDIDEADIMVLSQGLEKTSRLTHQINKSLSKISKTSSQSSQLFAPILSRNNVLKTLQRNIDSTLNSVASVKDLANEASRHEVMLGKGIEKIGLKSYTIELHKLEDMYQDMRAGKSKHEQNAEFHGILTHIAEMISNSEEELKLKFISLLNTMPPFDPQINMEKKIPFPYYEDKILSQMVIIFNYFYVKSDDTGIQDVFIQERTQQITKSMAFLEPFAKKIITTKNAPYEKGSSGFLSYTEALLGFIANERSLVDDLFAQYPEIKPRILNNILNPIVGNFCKLLASDLNFVRENLENAGLFSFELAECMNGVLRATKGKLLKNQDQIDNANKQVKEVTQSLFKDAVERIGRKANHMSQIPSDNGVTEATVDTMSRLRKFSEYKTGCLAAMENMSRENWLPHNYKEKEYTFQSSTFDQSRPSSLLSCFISDCIDTLVINLERRAQSLLNPQVEPDVANANSSRNKFKQRIGFLILMNMTLVEQIVEKSELNTMLGQTGQARIEKLKKRYVDYLVADWKDLTVNLMDTVVIDSTGKKSKDKEQIKEKFRKFNEGFEELVSRTKQFKLTDPALTRILKTEIVALLIPMYERFYSRYKNLFKNPRKHIKYSPEDITNTISQTLR